MQEIKIREGYFITFEGVDGAGKSTHVAKLCEYLDEKGYQTVRYREPGGTPFGEDIRKVLLSRDKRTSLSDMLLFNAARSEGTSSIIKPALARGNLVVADRYYDSTRVYQGIVGSLDLGEVNQVIRIATQGVIPDLTLLIDADPMIVSRGEKDQFEARGVGYQQKLRNGFLEIADKERKRIKIIPYRREDIGGMQSQIRRIVDESLKQHIKDARYGVTI